MAKQSAGGGAIAEQPFSLTFNVETVRMAAYCTLVLMVVVGKVVTDNLVHGDIRDTTIFKIFGFNHICNVFDHMPSREISALLVLFFILPMAVFVVSSYYRTKRAASLGKVPQYLQTYNRIITPIAFFAVCYTYMWFVNVPDRDYGFIAHYLPYVALQAALGLLAIQEVSYLIHTGALPFGASATLAKAYLVLLLATTVTCQTAVFSMLAGHPLLDSACTLSPAANGTSPFDVAYLQSATVNCDTQNKTAAIAFEGLMYFYSFQAIVMPIFFAARNRKNGHVNTITFG